MAEAEASDNNLRHMENTPQGVASDARGLAPRTFGGAPENERVELRCIATDVNIQQPVRHCMLWADEMADTARAANAEVAPEGEGHTVNERLYKVRAALLVTAGALSEEVDADMTAGNTNW